MLRHWPASGAAFMGKPKLESRIRAVARLTTGGVTRHDDGEAVVEDRAERVGGADAWPGQVRRADRLARAAPQVVSRVAA
jgi:hypothetical protein